MSSRHRSLGEHQGQRVVGVLIDAQPLAAARAQHLQQLFRLGGLLVVLRVRGVEVSCAVGLKVEDVVGNGL